MLLPSNGRTGYQYFPGGGGGGGDLKLVNEIKKTSIAKGVYTVYTTYNITFTIEKFFYLLEEHRCRQLSLRHSRGSLSL